MRKFIAHCTAILLISSLIGCTNRQIDKINIYEMESFQETKNDSLKEITDTTDISVIVSAFKLAVKNSGIADMADPHYKVELGTETYFLWIAENSGTIENIKDTHTTYSLSEKSAREIYQLVRSY
ncbi:hypothetical protein D3P08_03385 [Paenibacillus nanensis]|uniref:YhfM-like domain-containing protein n=1 Tax=Paenibacillus nanensis TaxID=393251 RepID=A0A3A1VL28_9BACL|nr:hypothetical protein [Paenibacillus nanensis]RIX59213.1 hypothetical protein D3P08_03385 [Paenibacillus nanensis]